jgi:polyferredoxin
MAARSETLSDKFLSKSAVRKKRQARLWWILLAVIIGGWWFPPLGLMVPACMFLAWGIAAARGRSWCNWMCPRGAFNDFILSRASRKKRIPALLRSTAFRAIVLAALFGIMLTRLVRAWPNFDGIGIIFVTLLTATTAVGIILGLIYHPRAWCYICPAGSAASWIGRAKRPRLQVKSNECRDCGLCSKACPMQLEPKAADKAGAAAKADCLKCSLCVDKCPTQALAWQQSE